MAEPLKGRPGVRVSIFDCSIENHFRAMDTICKLCEEPESDGPDETDIQRFSSSITFLREWRHFNYEPRIIKFASEVGDSQGKDVSDCIQLPQFSSATVLKQREGLNGKTSPKSCKDFVMYVGGSVWALDWCPRVHENPNSTVKCEFIAVAAHPPDSYYHKIGTPLTGRGIIQIWCMLNVGVEEEEAPLSKKRPKWRSQTTEAMEESPSKRPRGRPRKNPIDESQPDKVKRPKGRPRKKPIGESLNDDQNEQSFLPLAVQYPEGSFKPVAIDSALGNTQENAPNKSHHEKEKGEKEGAFTSDATPTTSVQSRKLKSKVQAKTNTHGKCLPLLTQNEETRSSSTINKQIHYNSGQEAMVHNNILDSNSSETPGSSIPRDNSSETPGSSIPRDIELPRTVLCLAHNGKVAWDVKWQPYDINDCECNQRMGYLAVLLGNGSLEVWEVPLPHMISIVYSSSPKQGTDPRFVKLEPVFKCSKLKCGDVQRRKNNSNERLCYVVQCSPCPILWLVDILDAPRGSDLLYSIPLTVEWSTSPPHNYLLAGCHDGMVALWKFSASGSPTDTRPLLCFIADTVPIRSVAWAPSGSDMESANVVLTAGHGGLKFWDIRDPFLPLWDVHPAPKFIYSLDWLPEPRCVILSFDDGTMKMLSLIQAACDVPVTGKPFTGTKQQGLHLYNCSSFAIWNVQVSRLTGMVAYCGADGNVTRFQLTSKAVDKDFSRNRAPHFVCGSLTEEESAIVVNTPLPDIPLTLKKQTNDYGEGPRSMRAFLTESNQAKNAKDNKAKVPTPDKQTLGMLDTPILLFDYFSLFYFFGNSEQILKSVAALCYGNDPGVESESEETLTLAALKGKIKQKSKSDRMKKAGDDQALAVRINEPANTQKEEAGNEIEVFPPKIVAMHRVRWNMNKGSERWLCYGGAAGIVRCQEIIVPDVAKKSARKS
ncbi:hypothetical protein QUC31_004341 [Theobroma cacao]